MQEPLLQQSYFPKHKFTEKEEIHEMIVPKLLDYMLYEIAKDDFYLLQESPEQSVQVGTNRSVRS